MIQLKRMLPVAFSGLLAVTMMSPDVEEDFSPVKQTALSSGSGEMIAQTPLATERRRVRRRTRRRTRRRVERREEKTNFISVSGNYYWKADLA